MENEQVEQVEQVNRVEQVEQVETMKMSTSSKYTDLGAALSAELMVAFWFAFGAILAIKMVNSMEELISRK